MEKSKRTDFLSSKYSHEALSYSYLNPDLHIKELLGEDAAWLKPAEIKKHSEDLENSVELYKKGKKNIKTAKFLGIASFLSFPILPLSFILGVSATGVAIAGKRKKEKAIKLVQESEIIRLKALGHQPKLSKKAQEKLKNIAQKNLLNSETMTKKQTAALQKENEKALKKEARSLAKKKIKNQINDAS